MKEAYGAILQGFEENRGRATEGVALVVVLLLLLLGFCWWYAVPIPTELPVTNHPSLAEVTREALK